MRLPTSKVYREFPQLDRFDDKTCRKIIKKAMRSDSFLNRLKDGIAIMLICILGMIFMMILSMAWALIALTSAPPRWSFATTNVILLVPFVIMWIAFHTILLLYTNQWYYRRVLQRRLGNSTCRQCGYVLLALPTLENTNPPRVACPECGKEQPAPAATDPSLFT